MTSVQAAAAASEGHAEKPRSLIVTVYGAYGRELGGWISIADLITLMAELGVDEPSVRSSISRLKRRGMLQAERRDGGAGYGLSEPAQRILQEGDRRIFGHRTAALSDGWVLAVFSIPESERQKRHTLRSELTGLGFGNTASGVWIAPAHLAEATHEVLERLGLTTYVNLFKGGQLIFSDLKQSVPKWWDLEALQALHVEFLREHEPVLTRWARRRRDRDAEAFADHVRALRDWRRLPFLDPGLPLELLPDDWAGARAYELFCRLHEELAGPALRHVRNVISHPDS